MEQRTASRQLLLLHLHIQLLLLLCLNYVNITPCLGEAISKADVCSTNSSSALTPCQAMVTYFPTSNIQLSKMASYFSIQNYTSLLGPNRFNLSIPDLPDVVLPAGYPFKIPIQSCACSPYLPNSASRVATSINYTVASGDTLSYISDIYYSQLVSYQAIGNASEISDYNKIFPNQSLSIPIPCACLADTDNKDQNDTIAAAKLLSYQVQKDDNLSAIATAYDASVDDLRSLNGNASDTDLVAYGILFVPLPGITHAPQRICENLTWQVLFMTQHLLRFVWGTYMCAHIAMEVHLFGGTYIWRSISLESCSCTKWMCNSSSGHTVMEGATYICGHIAMEVH